MKNLINGSFGVLGAAALIFTLESPKGSNSHPNNHSISVSCGNQQYSMSSIQEGTHRNMMRITRGLDDFPPSNGYEDVIFDPSKDQVIAFYSHSILNQVQGSIQELPIAIQKTFGKKLLDNARRCIVQAGDDTQVPSS